MYLTSFDKERDDWSSNRIYIQLHEIILKCSHDI